jgi:hypothetical protein
MVEDTNNGIDDDNAALLLEWLLVASQSTSSATCASAVQLSVSAVLTECEVFARWAYYCLETHTGEAADPRSTNAKGPRTPSCLRERKGDPGTSGIGPTSSSSTATDRAVAATPEGHDDSEG